jgi:AcrR family transcriptional regulator
MGIHPAESLKPGLDFPDDGLETKETLKVSAVGLFVMDEESTREWIFKRTGDWIFDRGFGSFTMDDVAAETGVSKKTLYRLVPSKNEFILQLIGRKMDQVEQIQKQILDDASLDFSGKIDAMFRVISDIVSRFRFNIVKDMVKSSPELWETIRKRRERILSGLIRIIEDGRSAGMVRTDISSDFLALFLQQVIDAVVTPGTAMKVDMSLDVILKSTLALILDGFLTESGREAVDPARRKR